jgi:hypothetical protein
VYEKDHKQSQKINDILEKGFSTQMKRKISSSSKALTPCPVDVAVISVGKHVFMHVPTGAAVPDFLSWPSAWVTHGFPSP